MKIRRLSKVLLAIPALGLLLVGGIYASYHKYVSLRQAKLIQQTRAFLGQSEIRKALLCLQRALQHDPTDLEACRLMAELTTVLHSTNSIAWRNRVVELNPSSLSDRLALAQTAMALRDYATASRALAGVDADGKKTAAYQNTAGSAAVAANQRAQAETHFLEAVRLEPQDLVPQLNLAVVRLLGTNAGAKSEARASLKRLSSNPANSFLRSEALRELVADAVRSQQTTAALEISCQLSKQTNSSFEDQILRLSILQNARDPDLKPFLRGLQRETANDTTNFNKVFELGLWQLTAIPPADTLTWLQSLPQNAQTNPPVAVLVAECYLKGKDWGGMQRFLEHQYWGELEFSRRAFQARALREQGLDGAAKGEWEMALKAAHGQKASLLFLLRFAAQWNWQAEREDLLWTIVNHYPDETWAINNLMNALFQEGRTRSLMRLLSRESKRNPSDFALKNNLAMTALLLDAQELKPHDLALEVYELSSSNSSYASTYAFSLYLQKKNRAALKVFQQISPKDLDAPGIAGYYGLVLKAAGDLEKAGVYLECASKARLLPEERELFERAKVGS